MTGFSSGLSVSDVVNVSVALSPTLAQQRNFGALLIVGDSDIIDTVQRTRQYSTLSGVIADFGSSAPETLAATAFFGATPQPSILYVGRWARVASSGRLMGATLTPAQQLLANFTSISNGGLAVTVDGVPHTLNAISLTAVTNLNGVASALTTALGGGATFYWDSVNLRFWVESATSGPTSSVTFASAASGANLANLMGLQQTNSGSYTVTGIAAETAATCIATLAGLSNAWYGLMFASSVMPADSDYIAVSALVQALSPSRIFGITTQEGAALTGAPGSATSIANTLAANRTAIQYSSSSPYAFAAAFGVAFTTNFNGSNTLYTLKFKPESGITAETLTETQAANLTAENCNVFVNYNNGVAILQQGTMTDGSYFDVIHGTDWLQNAIQTAVFNALVAAQKIPQTDAGVNSLVTVINNVLSQAVTNGLVAPGVWNGPPVGAIVTGQTLTLGYYTYAPPVASQSQAARAARQSPVLQCCIKLAGAIHSANVIVNVNQ